MGKKELHIFAFTLAMIGAVNWGLIGLFDFNLVTRIFGGYPSFVSLIYLLVGVSAIYLIATHASNCMLCTERENKKRK
ncbi:MAG TPA: DUF378 domain-containing protein [Patescibacteria group bacterium]|nr:DUF378 domain-containing protein [Patescibacteria group bacterium]